MPMGPCLTHCPKGGGGGGLAALGVLGAAVVAAAVAAWVTANLILVLAVAAVAVAVAAGAVWVLRWSRRLTLVSGPVAWRLAGYSPAPAAAVVQPRALRAVPREIEPGLLAGQTDPGAREALRVLSRGLRARYGTMEAPRVVQGAAAISEEAQHEFQ